MGSSTRLDSVVTVQYVVKEACLLEVEQGHDEIMLVGLLKARLVIVKHNY
jgi:hypothetical protein